MMMMIIIIIIIIGTTLLLHDYSSRTLYGMLSRQIERESISRSAMYTWFIFRRVGKLRKRQLV